MTFRCGWYVPGDGVGAYGLGVDSDNEWVDLPVSTESLNSQLKKTACHCHAGIDFSHSIFVKR